MPNVGAFALRRAQVLSVAWIHKLRARAYMSNIELENNQFKDSGIPELQTLSIVKRNIGKSCITFIGVEHEAPVKTYPWQQIQQYIESAGEHGKIGLEYFPPELEHTIYCLPLLGRYARWYSSYAGITQFFGGVGNIVARTEKEVLVFDPANSAAFQMLYLHLPLAAIALGVSRGCYEALQKIKGVTLLGKESVAASTGSSSQQNRKQWVRRTVLQGLVLGTLVIAGLEGVSWRIQDTRHRHSLQSFYRERSLNMRDMRWVTIAQGLTQYCTEDEQHIIMLYPPAHMIDGVLHYLDYPEQRKKKYRIYSKLLPGITKAIRSYRWESGDWRLTKRELITV